MADSAPGDRKKIGIISTRKADAQLFGAAYPLSTLQLGVDDSELRIRAA
jgi:hypothetical protein